MKNLRNSGIKRVAAIILVASMVLGSTNTFPVYAQEEPAVESETDAQAAKGLTIPYYDNFVTAEYGEEATFTVNATSDAGNISYQWYYYDEEEKECIKIDGATENSYTVKADESAKKNYHCIVTDGIETEKAWFYLIVDTLTIADYEDEVTAKYGEEVTFTINATSEVGKEISYQWYWWDEEEYCSIEIDGATENSYTVKADENAKEQYICEVTEGIKAERAKYVYFYLTVDRGLIIADYEEDVTAKYGEEVTFTVNATSGAGNISYQWYWWDGEEEEYIKIDGATENSYTVKADESAKDDYKCVVTDGVETENAYFYLTMDTLTIADYEDHVTVKYGEEVTFKVNATSEIGKEISYQWYWWDDENFEAIDGATDNSYTIRTDKNFDTRFCCVVTDGIETESVYFYLRVKPVEMEDCTISLPYTSTAYTGTALRPDVTVKYGTKVLQSGTDYIVSYENNINAGTASIIITGTNRYKYTGTTTKEFTIKAASLGKAIVDLSANSYNYDGKKKEPTVKSVKLGKQTLKLGTDYTVSYKNNTNIGTASVIITGKGNYTGTTTKSFTIKAVPISKATVALSTASDNYDGKAKQPKVKSVKLGKQTLKLGTDYTVSYKNNTNIGTASVIITGIGNYTGTATQRFTIKEKKGTIFASGSYKYKITSSTEVAFAGLKSKNTTAVTMPKTVKYGGQKFKVTAVADKAFSKNTKVTSVTIGSNVKTIGTSAFEGCKKLSKVTIGSNVTKLGNKAFKGCTSLKSITIPSKVTTIGKEAFQSCSKLSSITIKSTQLKKIDKNALKGIKSTAKIKVPAKQLKAYKSLLKNKGQSSKVKIGK